MKGLNHNRSSGLISRRQALQFFLRGAGCFALAVGSPIRLSGEHPDGGRVKIRFPQGVASGDPTPDSVVLWTRAEPERPLAQVPLRLQISLGPEFAEVIGERTVTALRSNDYTVRILVHELPSDSIFYYRFLAEDGTVSRLGRSRTAPPPDANRPVRVAYASCQAYEAGYFTAYRRLIETDKSATVDQQVDFVLHLGDFIYEALGYGGARKVPPFPDGGVNPAGQPYAESLADYRHLYKVYLQDPDLQEARARWPFVVTWDDHEFSDDCWQSVATYKGAGEPSQPRKYAANRAWFEFIPAFLSGLPNTLETPQHAHDFREASGAIVRADLSQFDDHGFAREPNNAAAVDSLCIYRSFRWGKHLDLLITDTRSYRTAHAVPAEINRLVSGQDRYITPLSLVTVMDAGRTYGQGNPPREIPLGEKRLPNPRADQPPGTILGAAQKDWLFSSLRHSSATWTVMASSVPMMPLRLDLGEIDPSAQTVVFTTDTWEGYLAERRELLEHVQASQVSNFIVLSGDHHSNYCGLLFKDFDVATPEPCGVEFSVCGISSPSLFSAVAGVTQPDDPMRALVTFDSRPFGGDHALQENLNVTFLFGTKAALAAATKGASADRLLALRNPGHNRHLRYADTNAYGVAVVEFAAAEAQIVFRVIAPPRQPDPQTSSLLREVRFRLPTWQAGEVPNLHGPEFRGTPPFPFGK